MRVFVTGAAGYIGHAVAKAFRNKGHTVFGLVRSEQDESLLSLNEIWPVKGNLAQPESYQAILEEVEVAVHCAFESSEKGVENDVKTIDTILNVFSRSSLPRSIIYTSGVWVYGSQRHKMVDESMPPQPLNIVKWRPLHEEKVLKATAPHLRTVVIRPGHVYGGVGGLMNLMLTSTQNGEVLIVGEGENYWPLIHLQDLAHAYVSAVEKELTNVVLNVVDDSTPTLREIAEAIAEAAGLEGKVKSISIEEGQKLFGHLVQGLTVDLTVSNSRIKRLLGWQIHHAPFIQEADLYYHAWKTTQQENEEF